MVKYKWVYIITNQIETRANLPGRSYLTSLFIGSFRACLFFRGLNVDIYFSNFPFFDDNYSYIHHVFRYNCGRINR
ncbi:hypothetical protein Hanom_Chr15g01339591 [Helianthus anomalus]